MTLTRQHLLDLAGQHPATDDAALAVAACVTSEESVALTDTQLNWLISTNKAKDKRSRRLAIFSFGIFLGFVVLLAWLRANSALLFIVNFAMMAILAATVRASSSACDQIACAQAQLSKLNPIAGSDWCEEALRYIESGYPGVSAWRDLALAERGQLYGFDVDVMKGLYHREEEKWAETDRERRNQEACRKLHGIEPVVA